jgi:hypothetical protein
VIHFQRAWSSLFQVTCFMDPHDSEFWTFRPSDSIGRSHPDPPYDRGSSYFCSTALLYHTQRAHTAPLRCILRSVRYCTPANSPRNNSSDMWRTVCRLVPAGTHAGSWMLTCCCSRPTCSSRWRVRWRARWEASRLRSRRLSGSL